jgi:hypothetical protein
MLIFILKIFLIRDSLMCLYFKAFWGEILVRFGLDSHHDRKSRVALAR